MEFSECFKFVSEEVFKAFPKEGMWVPFSDPNVKELPEVAREHTILAMLGVTSRTQRTRELLSAHNMVSAWRGSTPIKVEVGVFKKVKFIGFGCSTGPKEYCNTVAKRSTFNRAYDKATRLIEVMLHLSVVRGRGGLFTGLFTSSKIAPLARRLQLVYNLGF